MKKILITGIAAIIGITGLCGCTEQQMAKSYGGTTTIDLPSGRKLEEVTWKEDDLWILTRERKEGETIDTYYFNEDSSWDILEGTVILNETK